MTNPVTQQEHTSSFIQYKATIFGEGEDKRKSDLIRKLFKDVLQKDEYISAERLT